MSTTTKRNYRRRTDEERIAELESKLQNLQKKVEAKTRPDLPVLKEIPKLQRRLKAFAQLAVNYGRADLANSTMAFSAGLDRNLAESGVSRRGDSVEQDESED
jgi:molecular chaperone GrpE (heat shock protein)